MQNQSQIVDISSSREVVLNAPLLPRWEVKLRKEAILKMAHHSTSIEGNRLSEEEVSRLLSGEDIPAWEKDKQEVRGYVKVLEYIDRVGEEGIDGVSEDMILEIHRRTTQGILDDSETANKDMKLLLENQLVERMGKSRGIHYVLS